MNAVDLTWNTVGIQEILLDEFTGSKCHEGRMVAKS